MVKYPLMMISNINDLADMIVSGRPCKDVNSIYTLCAISEELVLSDKVALSGMDYHYFKSWGEHFCCSIESLFVDASESRQFLLPKENLKNEINIDIELYDEFVHKNFCGIDSPPTILLAAEAFREAILNHGDFETAYGSMNKSDFHYGDIGAQFKFDDLLKAITNTISMCSISLRHTVDANYTSFLDRGGRLYSPGHSENDRKFINYFAKSFKLDFCGDQRFMMNFKGASNQENRKMYDTLKKHHNLNQERIEKYTGLNDINVPPIFSLVLERSENRQDIPRAIVEVKYEFEEITRMQAEFTAQLNSAKTIKCQIEVIDQYENSLANLVKKITTRKRTTQERFFDILRPLSLDASLKNIARDFVSGAELKLNLSRVNRYINLHEQVLESMPVRKNIKRLFGDIGL